MRDLFKEYKTFIPSVWKMFSLIFCKLLFLRLNVRVSTEVSVLDWLLWWCWHLDELICVSPAPRPVLPLLLPTLLTYCHVAMATWEGPACTTPGSRRRSLMWGKGPWFFCFRVGVFSMDRVLVVRRNLFESGVLCLLHRLSEFYSQIVPSTQTRYFKK